MRECPQCGNAYPETFSFCPTDGSPLDGNTEENQRNNRPPAQIKVRTLLFGFLILVLCSIFAFAGVFFYQYWKPKYGELVVKTTPPGAMISVDGKVRGVSPLTLSALRSGRHQLKGVKEGYKEFNQPVSVMPYSTESIHWNLESIIPQLSNEQLAEVESWRKKLDSALEEGALLPPPEDYNVLYFADKILEIDPANSYATDVKTKLADNIRRQAELAYAREDWLEAEKQYKNLALLFPNDISIGERLADLAAKIDASIKDREAQIQVWISKAEAAMKVGSLVPPDKDNALDAIRSIQRLDSNNAYIRRAYSHVKELLQNQGDTKIAANDWQGAQNDFKLILQYFPEDSYSKERLKFVETKISEVALTEEQRNQRLNDEQQSLQKISALRQTARNSYEAGAYEKSISEWQTYLKYEPTSDEAYFFLGACYQNMKRLDTAILNFEKCLSLNPNNVLAHLNLGILYDYHRNNYQKAEFHLRRAMELGGHKEDYTRERLQSMIKDLQDRAMASKILKRPFPVEHKHTFTSCRGNLYFTEEGMEFRTTETDHSFYEAYKGLRAFDIEGDELSIKTLNNKKYNFKFINPGDAGRVLSWWNSTSHSVHVSGQAG